MTKRNRYDDTSSLGKSSLVPYRKGEDPKQRRSRPLSSNLNWKNKLLQWWPGSAKLVINQEWDKGVHCHDYKKLIAFLENTILCINPHVSMEE